ncbi:glycosyltransferase [Pedobacter hartonius]|uniref:Glycosyltransferase involved in cell wall bisynthesis n=1 Tax=Pedobacter hartonius TaxID=425514 RepID=A0A1H4B0H8_9SPHI|nr:glycosyltransferase [Pedobacter hartonius]SEA41643.1 Glycosyltransferase involved in cell wall bisynthesis [Pedobacter hartonius]
MKVLVIHTFDQPKTGSDHVVKNEIELLSMHGIQVELLRLRARTDFISIVQMLFDYAAYYKIKRRIRAFKPDIVHLHHLDFGSMAAAVYAVKRFKLPLVCTLHNYYLLCPSGTLFYGDQLYTGSLKYDFSYKSIQKALYRNSKFLTFGLSFSMFIHQLAGTWLYFDKIIVSGEFARELFIRSKLRVLADKMVVKPDFCYPAGKRRQKAAPAPYYLYAGELTDENGIAVLLEAFADNGLPVKVAGKGFLKKLVFGYSEFYPNISLVETDDMEYPDVLFENATALIFPAVWYDPFGSMVIRAFSSGLPVIASGAGYIPEMVTHGFNGLLFEAGSDKDLKSKISIFEALDWLECKSYRANALQTYHDKYGPQGAFSDLSGIYHALVQRHA